MPDGIAEADQAAAHLRDARVAYLNGEEVRMETVFVSRADLDALVESGASEAEISAWMQRQFDRHNAMRAQINDL